MENKVKYELEETHFGRFLTWLCDGLEKALTRMFFKRNKITKKDLFPKGVKHEIDMIIKEDSLIFKYMKHVDVTEGIDFTKSLNEYSGKHDVVFTQSEIDKLREFSRLVKKSYNEPTKKH